jgi:hypothetical protein
MKDKRKAYEEKLDAQLEEWNAKIALLKARADKGKASSFSLQKRVKREVPDEEVFIHD